MKSNLYICLIMNNYIFTDIDGVLNTINRNQWNKTSIDLYNRLCHEFNLKPVISSTWRLNHTKEQLQKIFTEQGITVTIYDFTDSFPDEGRGREIEDWILKNPINKGPNYKCSQEITIRIFNWLFVLNYY